MKNNDYLILLKKLKSLMSNEPDACGAIELLESKIKSMDDSNVSVKPKSPAVTGKQFPLPKISRDSKNSYFLYSDGACRGNPGPGAWGTMVQNSKGVVLYSGASVKESTTNNQMELEGAIRALLFMKTHLKEIGLESSKAKLFLYSDSKYVVNGLKSWIAGWKSRGWKKADKIAPKNLDYWKRIDDLRNQFENIEYHWVKGHSGHAQNEYCDLLANEELDKSGF